MYHLPSLSGFSALLNIDRFLRKKKNQAIIITSRYEYLINLNSCREINGCMCFKKHRAPHYRNYAQLFVKASTSSVW